MKSMRELVMVALIINQISQTVLKSACIKYIWRICLYRGFFFIFVKRVDRIVKYLL